MRPASPLLVEVLQHDFTVQLIVDAFRGATRTLPDVPCDDWSLSYDAESDIKAAGSITAIVTSDTGKSYSPAAVTDVFAPYGQEVNVSIEISAGDFKEVVRLGWFPIAEVPKTRDGAFIVRGQQVSSATLVQLTLEGRLRTVRRWGFPSEQTPPSLTSAWSEMQRLTGMQLHRNVPDRPIPSTVVYQANTGGRLKGVQDLAAALGGVPIVTADGALSVLPDARRPTSGTLRALGQKSTLLDQSKTLSPDDVCNEIIGDFETPDRDPIHAEARLTQGPLSVYGIYGTNTRYIDQKDYPWVTDQAGADRAVREELTKASSIRVYRLKGKYILNPLVEIGDTWRIELEDGTTVDGRIINVTLSSDLTMDVEAEVRSGI